jgi:hydrogenase-4 component F
MISSVPNLVVAVPLLAAIVLALLPQWRVAAWVNLGAAALAFGLACRLPWQGSAAGSWLLADPLAVHLVLLTSFVGLTSAWYSRFYVAMEVESGRLNGPRLRLYHAMFQALLGFMLLAILSDNLGVTWGAVEAGTIAAVLVVGLPNTVDAARASWKFFILAGVGIALALFGTIVLYLAASPALGPGWAAMSWSALALAAPRCNGTVLNLAFVFLLLGYGTKAALVPLHAWMPDAHAQGPTPVNAILSSSLLNVALFIILRLRGVMDENADAIAPGGPIMALGMASLLVGSFSLWRRRDVVRFFSFSTIEQSGLAAFAFGLGGAAATFAGLLHLTLHTLAKASVFQVVGRAAQAKGAQDFPTMGGLLLTDRVAGLTLVAGVIAIAGLPPFGLFTSEFLVVMQTVHLAPLVAAPLLLGLVGGAWVLIARLQGLGLGAGEPNRHTAFPVIGLAGAWVHLVIVLVLGLAMPAGIVAWMQGIAAVAR